MTATTSVYDNAQKHLDDDVDWTSDTIKVILVSSSYTFSAAHEYLSDITGELATGNGYTAGGATLSGKSRTVTGAVTAYKAATTTWTPGSGQTLTGRRAIVLKSTGTASTSPLLCSVLMDNTPADVSATNANFSLAWDATDGVFKVTRT